MTIQNIIAYISVFGAFYSLITQSFKIKNLYDQLTYKDRQVEKDLSQINFKINELQRVRRAVYYNHIRMMLAIKNLQEFLAQSEFKYRIRKDHEMNAEKYLDILDNYSNNSKCD